MNNELKNAFNKIQAGDALKENTLLFLREKMRGRHRPMRRRFRWHIASAMMALLILVSGLAYNLYFTPNAYVDMDVNPSIGLTLNRFGRVLDVQAYNNDGIAILADLNVRFKSYDEAAGVLLDVIIAEGYLAADGLISVTVQADSEMENDLLTGLKQMVAMALAEHHANVQTDVFVVTDEIKLNAQEHHMTPAMYLAITELQAVDPTATFEGCMGHSIRELQALTQGNGVGCHGRVGENAQDNQDRQDRGMNDPNNETDAEILPENRHGDSVNGHHGGGANGRGMNGGGMNRGGMNESGINESDTNGDDMNGDMGR